MDYSISSRAPSSSSSSSSLFRSSPKKALIPCLSSRVCLPFNFRWKIARQRSTTSDRCLSNLRKVFAAAAASSSSSSSAGGGSQCGEYFSCLNTPLEPSSAAGKLFAGVLLDKRECFPLLVKEQLEQFAVDRSHAVAPMSLSVDSDEACLYRRITELKDQERQTAVHDLMYLLICYKFYSIGVHLVPKLSKCIYNGRLEICPSADWELESIHSLSALEMIKDHITACVGWKANATVPYMWDRIKVPRLQLYRVYTASVVFGYFLKSVSLRHNLEQVLCPTNVDLKLPLISSIPNPDLLSSGSNTAYLDLPKEQDLKYYLMGFDSQSVQRCATPKSKEAVNLIERHSSALFGDEMTGSVDTNEVICTSFATLKRFVLEAIAFGTFVWEAEQYIGNVYELEEN